MDLKSIETSIDSRLDQVKHMILELSTNLDNGLKSGQIEDAKKPHLYAKLKNYKGAIDSIDLARAFIHRD